MKSKTYQEFIEKFEPKLTTDDCITPDAIYSCVRDWVCNKYGIDANKIVRPFWKGRDYAQDHYPEDCVVVDNPPFSILSKICEFYIKRGIKFFLFAPALTLLGGKKICMKTNHIATGFAIEYENGAKVATSFITNLGDNDIILQTAPDLYNALGKAQNAANTSKAMPKYEYPDNIITAALMQRYCKYGVDLKIKAGDCIRVTALEHQKRNGKEIFGGGLLLSERAAAERAAAERAAAERAAAERAAAERAAATVWELSPSEMENVKSLGNH